MDTWEAIAHQFMELRSEIGAGLIRDWARQHLAPGAAVLDVGCGSGVPVAVGLSEAGFQVFGIDAAPSMVDAFRKHVPGAEAACEAVQESRFFDRTFDAVIAVGLIFLLSEEDQLSLIGKLADALRPSGRLLFSAPQQKCEWRDSLTGQRSVSLGAEAYQRIFEACGLCLIGTFVDEGDNYYYDAVKMNSRVTIHMTASLDGFIAKRNGQVDWLETSDTFEGGREMTAEYVNTFLQTIDCYVMGSRTYETALHFAKQGLGWPYGDKPTFVLTSRMLEKARESVVFHAGDLREFVNQTLRPKFRSIWFAGGGELSASCLRLGLADEVRYTVLPIAIGDGISFFAGLDRDVAMHLLEVTPYKNGMVELRYEVVGGPQRIPYT